MKIDAGKWYKTRSGLMALVINVDDFDPKYPVLATIEGVGYVTFTKDGRVWDGLVHRFDLVSQLGSDRLREEQARLEEVLFD